MNLPRKTFINTIFLKRKINNLLKNYDLAIFGKWSVERIFVKSADSHKKKEKGGTARSAAVRRSALALTTRWQSSTRILSWGEMGVEVLCWSRAKLWPHWWDSVGVVREQGFFIILIQWEHSLLPGRPRLPEDRRREWIHKFYILWSEYLWQGGTFYSRASLVRSLSILSASCHVLRISWVSPCLMHLTSSSTILENKQTPLKLVSLKLKGQHRQDTNEFRSGVTCPCRFADQSLHWNILWTQAWLWCLIKKSKIRL